LRTSVAVAALTIAIAMMVAVAILIGSFRTTVVAWANETLRADLFVQPAGAGDASFDARMPPTTVARIAAVPGVAEIDTFRGLVIPLRGRLTTLGATDLERAARRRELRFVGPADGPAMAHLPGSNAVLVSEPFATKFGIGVGDRFTIETPSGPLELGVAAVYNDYSSDAGIVLIDRRTFVRSFGDEDVNSVAVYVRPGTDPAALRSAIVRAVAPRRVEVQTNRELRALVIAIFNRTFAITYALYVISIAIAVLGVVTTLFALVLERRREIGIVRYLGLRARDVRRMVLVEAGCIGLLGGVLGVGLGSVLALLLIFTINRQAFGWLIELHVPYAFLGETLVLVVAAALAAGIVPARVAARLRTADAVRTE
jgi:putative ABC transport system permease protein